MRPYRITADPGRWPRGVDMAQVVRRLGGEAVVVDTSAHVLAREPAPLGEALGEALRKDGVELVLSASAALARRDGEDFVLSSAVDLSRHPSPGPVGVAQPGCSPSCCWHWCRRLPLSLSRSSSSWRCCCPCDGSSCSPFWAHGSAGSAVRGTFLVIPVLSFMALVEDLAELY